jgi:hypothetical protein
MLKEKEQEKAKLERLWAEGYIRDKDKITYLAEQLSHPDPDIYQLAAQIIIEEVLGEENKNLRLKALDTLRPYISPDQDNPCHGQVDLHTHDFFSEDGYPTPTALVLEAYKKGLAGLAVISHNQRYNDDEAEKAAQILVQEKLLYLHERYGDKLCLSQEDLNQAKRGEVVYPFTIAVALWKKYKETFQKGFIFDEGRNRKEIVLNSINEVYQQFIRRDKNELKTEGDEQSPDLQSIATRAILLNRKLIIPHPNEYSREAFERILEDLALVDWGRKRYAGTLIGVEYYSNKLKGENREYVREYIEKLNREHPVYTNFPLLLLPGSDSHGLYSPDCPLGLGHNFPLDKQKYKNDIYQALKRPVIEFSI